MSVFVGRQRGPRGVRTPGEFVLTHPCGAAGGTIPTLPVLGRIAHALDADLTIQISARTGAA